VLRAALASGQPRLSASAASRVSAWAIRLVIGVPRYPIWPTVSHSTGPFMHIYAAGASAAGASTSATTLFGFNPIWEFNKELLKFQTPHTISQTLGGPGMAHSHLNRSSTPASSFNGLAIMFCKIAHANSLQ